MALHRPTIKTREWEYLQGLLGKSQYRSVRHMNRQKGTRGALMKIHSAQMKKERKKKDIRSLSKKEKEYLTVSQFEVFASVELVEWMKRCNEDGKDKTGKPNLTQEKNEA